MNFAFKMMNCVFKMMNSVLAFELVEGQYASDHGH